VSNGVRCQGLYVKKTFEISRLRFYEILSSRRVHSDEVKILLRARRAKKLTLDYLT
jgi:sulfite reductase alpha subunit-like flavoprotein